MLLPGGFPAVFADDCARGHIMAVMKAQAGDCFILSDAYFSLVELAGIVQRLHPIKIISPVMPLWFARAYAVAGEAVSSITGRPPLLARILLTFFYGRPARTVIMRDRLPAGRLSESKKG